jgi:hypothetical protein
VRRTECRRPATIGITDRLFKVAFSFHTDSMLEAGEEKKDRQERKEKQFFWRKIIFFLEKNQFFLVFFLLSMLGRRSLKSPSICNTVESSHQLMLLRESSNDDVALSRAEEMKKQKQFFAKFTFFSSCRFWRGACSIVDERHALLPDQCCSVSQVSVVTKTSHS